MKKNISELKAAADRVTKLASDRRKRQTDRKVKASGKSAKAPARKKRVAAKTKVKALDQSAPPNGGFEKSTLSKAPDNANLGEEDYGYSIPPELEKAVEEGQAETSADESFQPGVLIPPGLEEAVMAVADPEDLVADDDDEPIDFDLVPFAPDEAESAADVMQAGAHWVLFANGNPVARIDLKDQDHAEKIAAHFVSMDFARMVIDGIKKHGIKATLDDLKAKPYVAKVDQNKKVEQIRAELSARSEESLRQARAQVKATYVNNLGLVLEASANNFIVENPLKDALIAAFRSVNVPEDTAVQLVDAAFFQHGVKTFAALLDKAEDWSNLSAEALAEIKNAMQAAGKRAYPLPSQRSAAESNPDYNQGLANEMAARAVPVQASRMSDTNVASASAASPAKADPTSKDAYRRKHGRFSTY